MNKLIKLTNVIIKFGRKGPVTKLIGKKYKINELIFIKLPSIPFFILS
jgi:hypothetical protein